MWNFSCDYDVIELQGASALIAINSDGTACQGQILMHHPKSRYADAVVTRVPHSEQRYGGTVFYLLNRFSRNTYECRSIFAWPITLSAV